MASLGPWYLGIWIHFSFSPPRPHAQALRGGSGARAVYITSVVLLCSPRSVSRIILAIIFFSTADLPETLLSALYGLTQFSES